MGPMRSRQVISFEKLPYGDTDVTQPKLTVFEHIGGAKARTGLLP